GRRRRAGPQRRARWQRRSAAADSGGRGSTQAGRTYPSSLSQMRARDLFTGAELKHPLPPSLADAEIHGLDYDSRRVEAGFAFFAFPGSRVDGREFARQAVAKGAVLVAGEADPPDDLKHLWVTLAHGRRGLAIAARNFYGKPDERLGLTGITGTNGKTTTGFLIDGILRASGAVTAL